MATDITGRVPGNGLLVRRVYEVEVLYRQDHTETDLDSASLESLAHETNQGAASGLVSIKSTELLTTDEMARALKRQGSDAGFLLDEDEIAGLRVGVTVYRLSLADLDAYAGREVTEEEAERFSDAIGNSTISDTISTVLGSITDDDDENSESD